VREAPNDIDPDILLSAASATTRAMFPREPQTREMYSHREAIAGRENDPCFRPIDRSTSAGYPINNAKKCFLDEDYEYFGKTGANMRETVEAGLRDLADGHMPAWTFTDSLKDERRPLAKVAQKSTRLISGAAYPTTIVCRQVYGPMCREITAQRISNGTAVGVNPYSDEWDSIGKLLASMGGGPDEVAYGAGDYKGFDFSQNQTVLTAIRDEIQKWFGDPVDSGQFVARQTIFNDLMNSRHVRGSKIMQWSSGLPSGHPLTTLVNCFYNHLAFRYCWIRINGSDLAASNTFENHVTLFVLGDDNVFAVDREYRDRFTPITIAPFMEELGLTYTSDVKDDPLGGMRMLKDVTFLKRRFIFDVPLQRFLCPMELPAILEVPCWTRRGSYDTFKANCVWAVRELSMHPKEIFDLWVQRLKRATEKPGIFVDGTDHTTVRGIVLSLVGQL
jgi:hypothetical protein